MEKNFLKINDELFNDSVINKNEMEVMQGGGANYTFVDTESQLGNGMTDPDRPTD